MFTGEDPHRPAGGFGEGPGAEDERVVWDQLTWPNLIQGLAEFHGQHQASTEQEGLASAGFQQSEVEWVSLSGPRGRG